MKLPSLRIPPQAVATAVRVGMFALFAIGGMILFGWVLMALGFLLASILGVFLAATFANFLCMRIFEQRPLADVGLHWSRASAWNLLIGVVGGAAPALLIVIGPLIFGGAELVAVPGGKATVASLLFWAIMILFGAFGEELLFRGYAFQRLMAAMGTFATILPVSVLFALAHKDNPNVTALGLFNTFAWGVLLGVGFWRSGDLWMPVGLHAGWNWMLPLFGTNLSGFTMNVSGYEMRWKIDPRWSGGAYGPEGGLLATLVLIALFLWLVWKAPVRRQTPALLREQWDED